MSTQYEKVKEITEQLEQGIKDLMTDPNGKYQQWLDVMSRFHNYSLNNTLLILQQKPDATLVAGFDAWQKKFGRNVNKGAKGIKIIAPAPYKKNVETEVVDSSTNMPVKDAEGNAVKTNREVTVNAFKITSVFDVTDTYGKGLPTFGPELLTGNVDQYEKFFEALKAVCPVPISFEEMKGGANGYFQPAENRIAIKQGLSEAQTVKTCIHEMAHQRCHSENGKDAGQQVARNRMEQEAESVAYTVCKHFGIDTSDYSFAYVAGWAQDKELKDLKASMDTIRKAASGMINEIDEKLKEFSEQKETKVQDIISLAAGAMSLEKDKVSVKDELLKIRINMNEEKPGIVSEKKKQKAVQNAR